MTDKKTFGSFIKIKRTEKNYSQKDLAEMLFVFTILLLQSINIWQPFMLTPAIRVPAMDFFLFCYVAAYVCFELIHL